ncbi:MAG TPA: hypothetical protein VNZ22_23200 [Bacillota bacterium]|nr:hypothetical protein [Bacillota bacterium]
MNLSKGLEQAWTNLMTFVPQLLLAIAILVVGYFVAKLLCRGLDKLLERVGFDRLVERGGVKKVLAQTQYDASGLLSKIVFYGIFLLVLQFAFGVFGPNPISEILTKVIAYLPSIFVAVLIVIVASAVAAAVKDILQATMAGLAYGRLVASIVSAFIVATGIFAALNQLEIAPAIVNGVFYALLAIIAGSAIVAIGGGGIIPMRSQWDKLLARMEQENARSLAASQMPPGNGEKQPASRAVKPGGEVGNEAAQIH